jgi:serine/threonine protein kinase
VDGADAADGEGKRKSSFVGTAEYMAPEVLEGEPLTRAVDFWGWACTLFQVRAAALPLCEVRCGL